MGIYFVKSDFYGDFMFGNLIVYGLVLTADLFGRFFEEIAMNKLSLLMEFEPKLCFGSISSNQRLSFDTPARFASSLEIKIQNLFAIY